MKRYTNTSFQERQCMNCESDLEFWDAVPVLETGAEYLLGVRVEKPENHIKWRVSRWLDAYFYGEPEHICQRDCEDFLEQHKDFKGHEPAMVLALARVIARARKKH